MAGAFLAGSILSHVILDTKKWTAGVVKVNKDQKLMGVMSAKTAKKMRSIGLAATAVGGMVVLAMGKATKIFGDFDSAMKESTSIMGDLSEKTKKDLRDTAIQMSTESTFAAKELGEAYYFLASAGLDADQSIAALPVVMKFAQAGAFDLASATDLLTDAQSALGKSSDDAAINQERMIGLSDILVRAGTLANATVRQFSEALTNKSGPAMRAYGVETETGVALLAAFADQGVKGREAGTQLGIVLREMQKAVKENSEAFKEAGISVYDSNGNLQNFGDTVKQLEDRLIPMSAEQKKAELGMLGFSERSQLALLTLLGTSEKIKEYEAALRVAGGVTEEVSEKQLTSFNNQMKIAKNQVTTAALVIGEQLAPVVVEIARKVGTAVKSFSDWAKKNPELFNTLVKVTAGVSGVLLVLGPLVAIFPRIVSGIALISKASLGWSFALGTVPIAVTAAYLAYKKLLDIREKFEKKTGKFVDDETKAWAEYAEEIGGASKVLIDFGGTLEAEMKKLGDNEKAVEIAAQIRKEWQETGQTVEVYKKIADGAFGPEAQTALKNLGGAHLKAAMDAKEQEKQLNDLVVESKKLMEESKGIGPAIEYTMEQAEEGTSAYREELEELLDVLNSQVPTSIAAFNSGLDASVDLMVDLTSKQDATKRSTEDLGNQWFDSFEKIAESTDGAKGEVEGFGRGVEDTINLGQEFARIWMDSMKNIGSAISSAFFSATGMAKWFTTEATKFNNDYWSRATEEAEAHFSEKERLLNEDLEKMQDHYSDLEDAARDAYDDIRDAIDTQYAAIEKTARREYEDKRDWIRENVKDEKQRNAMLKELRRDYEDYVDNLKIQEKEKLKAEEDKYQSQLDTIRAEQKAKEEALKNEIVAIREAQAAEEKRILEEEDIARQQHADDEEKRQNSLWSNVKGIFGTALEEMATMWTTKFITDLVTSAGKAGSKLATTITPAISGIGGAITGIAEGVASILPAIATAIAAAATTLAAAAPAILTVGAVAITLYAGFMAVNKLLGSGGGKGSSDVTYWLKMIHESTKDTIDFLRANLQDKLDFYATKLSVIGDTVNTKLAGIWKDTGDLSHISKKLDKLDGIAVSMNLLLEKTGNAAVGAIHTAPGFFAVGEDAPRVPEITAPIPQLLTAMKGGDQPTKIFLTINNQTEEIDMAEGVKEIMIQATPELTSQGRMKINQRAIVQE